MTQQSDKTPPEVITEEDTPLNGATEKDNLQKEKDASNPMDWRKFTLGSSTLGWCIFLMFVCVIISLWQPDNTLLQNAFDAFKLIVMTILGYIFGSSAKN